MILGGSFVGGSILVNLPKSIPTSRYLDLKVNGSLIVDKIRVLSKELSEQEKDNLRPTDEYVWSDDTLLYAEFNNDLSAGNVGGLSDTVVGVQLFRREDDESTFKRIATIPISDIIAGKTSYDDYTATTNKSYQYRLYVETNTELSEPVDATPINTDFFYWSLINPETKQAYIFDLNLDSGSIASNTDMTVYDSAYTAKPAVSFSEKDYVSGSISCLAGHANVSDGSMVHYYPKDYISGLKDFINDKTEKYLKSRSGEIWKVLTSNFEWSYVDEVGEQIADIKFDFIEVGEV